MLDWKHRRDIMVLARPDAIDEAKKVIWQRLPVLDALRAAAFSKVIAVIAARLICCG